MYIIADSFTVVKIHVGESSCSMPTLIYFLCVGYYFNLPRHHNLFAHKNMDFRIDLQASLQGAGTPPLSSSSLLYITNRLTLYRLNAESKNHKRNGSGFPELLQGWQGRGGRAEGFIRDIDLPSESGSSASWNTNALRSSVRIIGDVYLDTAPLSFFSL